MSILSLMRRVFILLAISAAMTTSMAQSAKPSYNDSLVLAPLYIEYASVSEDKFASEATELRRRLGQAPHVMLGFAAFLSFDYDGNPELDRPIDKSMLASTLREAHLIVQRARANGLVTHIGLVSGFFHSWNRLREVAIREDVRNAQWFADGWIAPPQDLRNPRVVPRSVWATPSSYAIPLRARMEETVRMVARSLAEEMAAFPDTFVSASGDGEVELTWERNLGPGATSRNNSEVFYSDYSPFAVAEFRDSLRYPRYAGDRSPNTDDNGDGHTFNKDFGRTFTTWGLKYFDESGPISFASYLALQNKLPGSGVYFKSGGFDAPRIPNPGDALWDAWLRFRRQMIANYVRDFARWVTTSLSDTAFTIPPARFYSHQIPADFLFAQPDNIRLRISASPVETAFIAPFGSAGVTAYNLFNGKQHLKTATSALFSQIAGQSSNWGLLEYNPSAPSQPTIAPIDDLNYYSDELRLLDTFRPHVVIPFPWTEIPEHSQAAIKDRPFERALRRFVQDVGNSPWLPRPGR